PESRSPACSVPCAAICEWAARRQSPKLSARRRSCGGVQLLRIRRHREHDCENRAAAVGPIGRGDGSVHRLDETARNREAKPGARPHLIGLLHAVELVEYLFEIGRRNAFALIQHLKNGGSAVPPTLYTHSRAAGSIFRSI